MLQNRSPLGYPPNGSLTAYCGQLRTSFWLSLGISGRICSGYRLILARLRGFPSSGLVYPTALSRYFVWSIHMVVRICERASLCNRPGEGPSRTNTGRDDWGNRMDVLESRSTVGPTASSVVDEAMGNVARFVEIASQLPAIATLDWCDLAAACLSKLAHALNICVMIATIEPDGVIRDIEAIGFATDRPHDAGRLNDLRCRAELWNHLGLRRIDTEGKIAAVIAEDAGGATWTGSPLGRTWAELNAARVIVSVGALGAATSGRCLVTMLATPDAAQAAALVSEVRAVMPILLRRALLAIGPERTRRNNWISPKELDVLDQLVLGKSVREIAEAMDRSPHTVHDHVKSLHRKLGASSRGELIARALGHHGGAKRGTMPLVDRSDYADLPDKRMS